MEIQDVGFFSGGKSTDRSALTLRRSILHHAQEQ
jgi:hypothetical protein